MSCEVDLELDADDGAEDYGHVSLGPPVFDYDSSDNHGDGWCGECGASVFFTGTRGSLRSYRCEGCGGAGLR